VVIQGEADEVADPSRLAPIDAAYTAKYGSSMLIGDSPPFAVRPRLAIGMVDGDPAAAVLPTRWRL